ncbi:MAG TPA: thioredoxin family protein [Planctomycetota bacterium]|nr:thioredoxin family protein [Planctomycetota bacterium]
MVRFALAAAVAALLPVGPPWIKLDEAFAAAASTEKLIAVYCPLPATDNMEDESSADADKALLSKEVAARFGEFFWVKAWDRATLKRIDAPEKGTHFVFVDPDGGTVGVWQHQMGGVKALLKALDEAKSLYQRADVPWFDGEPDTADEKFRRKLIVYSFLDDKEPSAKVIKALEHPWVARDHARVVFVRKYVLDSPLAKRFKITSAPTLVFYDATQKEGKEVVERISGEVKVRQVRAPMKKFFERLKKLTAEGK